MFLLPLAYTTYCSKNHHIYKKKCYDPFLWMGFNCLKATEPLLGDSLLFTTKSPRCPGTHLISLVLVKGCVNLGAT